VYGPRDVPLFGNKETQLKHVHAESAAATIVRFLICQGLQPAGFFVSHGMQ
jgi:hypothetical protein